MSRLPGQGRFEKLINIKDRGQIFRVDVDSIERIEAAGDYMCIYIANNSFILRETMKDLERRLDPRVFQRVHRSWIVNLDLVPPGQAAYQWRMLPGAGVGGRGEGQPVVSGCGGAVRALIPNAAVASPRNRRWARKARPMNMVGAIVAPQ